MKSLEAISKLREGSGTRSVATLRLASATVDGETITLGDYTLEIDTDGDVTEGNIALDLSDDATAATGTLTLTANPTADDTMTIGAKVYTFVAEATEADEITIGGTVEETIDNAVDEITGEGIGTAHPLVTASKATASTMTVTALTPGTDGNSIATTETFTGETNVFGAETLEGGADISAADSRTGIAAAINEASVPFAAVAVGTGIVIYGEGFGDFATTETLAGSNNAFGAAVSAGGARSGGSYDSFRATVQAARQPTAQEVAVGGMAFAFPFPVASLAVTVRDTNGAAKAWDGAATIDGSVVTLDISGSTDWAATDTVTITAALNIAVI